MVLGRSWYRWPERGSGGGRRTGGRVVAGLGSASVQTTRRSDSEKKERLVSQRSETLRSGDVWRGRDQPPQLLPPPRYVFPSASCFFLFTGAEIPFCPRVSLTLQVFHWSSCSNGLTSLNWQSAVIKGSRPCRGQRSAEPDSLQQHDLLNKSHRLRTSFRLFHLLRVWTHDLTLRIQPPNHVF